MRGKLIALEGIDSCGKATQTKLLVERLIRDCQKATSFSYPDYDTDTGRLIKGHLTEKWAACDLGMPGVLRRRTEDPMVFQSLMTINRYESATKLQVTLESGMDVVLDRYWGSGMVYGMTDGLSREWLERIHQSLPKADLMILVDIPVEESFRRRIERRDRHETNRGFLERVRQTYLDVFLASHRIGDLTRWVIVDGTGSTEEVSERIWSVARPIIYQSP